MHQNFIDLSRKSEIRSAILEILRTASSALSHKEVMDSLNGLCDRVTVYRVLDRLLEDGHLHKIVDLSGVMRFAVCQDCEQDHHHHQHVHFSCTNCESVICLEEVEPQIALPKGFVAHEAMYTFSGLCPSCSV